eukprot:461535-Pleurochrysis_carterae.AAC.1
MRRPRALSHGCAALRASGSPLAALLLLLHQRLAAHSQEHRYITSQEPAPVMRRAYEARAVNEPAPACSFTQFLGLDPHS